MKVISFLFYFWAYYSFTLLYMYAFSLIISFIEIDFFPTYSGKGNFLRAKNNVFPVMVLD